MAGETAVGVLRIRPINQQKDGLLRSGLIHLAESLGVTRPDEDIKFRRHVFDPEVGHTTDRVGDLSDEIADLVASVDYLILDLCYRNVRRRAYSLVLAESLRQLRSLLSANDVKVLVLMDEFLPSSDEFMSELMTSPWASHSRIVNAEGKFLGTDDVWYLPPDALSRCRLTLELYSDTFKRRIVRMRGVFAHPHEGTAQYSQYRYIGDAGTDALSRLLSKFVADRNIDAIVVPDDASPWFVGAVMDAAVENQTKVLFPRNMKSSGQSVATPEIVDAVRHLAGLRAPEVLVAVPVYRIGRSLRAAAGESAAFFKSPRMSYFTAIAVGPAGANVPGGGAIRTGHVSVNGTDETLHFVHAVGADPLGAQSWQVRSAVALGEVSIPPHQWVGPSRVAMWSLFEKVGMGAENPFTPGSRPRVGHFPALLEMDEVDARWLAFGLLRATGSAGTDILDDVLMVLPNEASGARAIARSLREDLDVAVAMTDLELLRANVELDDAAKALVADYAGRRIFVCDESSVGGRTLVKLNAAVEKVRGTPADGALAVVAADLGIADAGMQALYRWRPYFLDPDAV
jgi:hypothetical protein